MNHVKVHQIFNILKEDFRDEETIGVDRDPVLGTNLHTLCDLHLVLGNLHILCDLHPVLGYAHRVLGNLHPVLGDLHPISVADPDPGSGAFLTPGSGIRNFSGFRIPDLRSRIPDPKPIFLIA